MDTIAVIGGGVSGLTAATYLHQRGYAVSVFEKEDRVGGQVYSKFIRSALPVGELGSGTPFCELGPPSELGAVIAFEGEFTELADSLGISQQNFQMKYIIYKEDGTMTTYNEAIMSMGRIKFFLEMFFLRRLFCKYPEIQEPGLANHHKALFVPFETFARRNGFPVFGKALTSLFVATGYGYDDTIPAAYYLKLLATIINPDLTLNARKIFPCGFSSFLEAIAAELPDVILETKITSISRPNGQQIQLTDQAGNVYFYDKLIIGCPLETISSIMDVNEEESDLFKRITTYPYLTTYFDGSYLNEQNDEDNALFIAYEENESEERQNHINLLIAKNEELASSAAAWQIMKDKTSVEEATGVLKEDLMKYHKLNITEIRHQEYWKSYFPVVSTEDFLAGFHDRIENLQGDQNTYYLGPSLSFHTTNAVYNFAKDLVERKFPDLN